MNQHLIEEKLHADFLAQKRQDPITGDNIQAGDTVVFCAACKSVFLVDTWLYLNQTHCGQQKILATLPQAENLTLKSPKYQLGETLFQTRGAVSTVKWYLPSVDDAPVLLAFLIGAIGTWKMETTDIDMVYVIIFILFSFFPLFVLFMVSKKFFISSLFYFILRKRAAWLKIAQNGIEAQYGQDGTRFFSPQIHHIEIRPALGKKLKMDIYTLAEGKLKRNRVHVFLEEYAEARDFFTSLVDLSQQFEVRVDIKNLPTYDYRFSLSSHIYYLINYRAAKFTIF
ncbi:hypothetical protein [Hugenholtzia roseola]|uniref:hypothetical protein n=1 Tax=Hugenholtzia roseola TaxID=1002 RepID=UPI000408294B|nr:hypothetical protein [Hugenholtzia roseola]